MVKFFEGRASRRGYLLFASLTVVLLAHAKLVIGAFTGPLVGSGDTEYWEFTGYYLREHLSFSLLPKLDLINDSAFYPYGVNHVFQPWGLERDYLYAIFSHWFGAGPWLQTYYLVSVAIAFLGTFYLLDREYGFGKSLAASFFVTIIAYYSIAKFPIHLGYSIVHWTVLSIIVDFLLVKRFYLNRLLPLRLILFRGALLFLCLGQELGYVAGCALTSMSISFIWICGLSLVKSIKVQPVKAPILRQVNDWKNEFREHSVLCCSFIILMLASSYLYVPLILQISNAAKLFENMPAGNWPSNPLRLAVPILPYVGAANPIWQDVMAVNETFLDGSPGYFLLVLAGAGLWAERKKWPMFFPLLAMFVAFAAYSPVNFPILKIFPWFRFSRLAGRLTIAYPAILGILAIHAKTPPWRSTRRRWLQVCVVLLACLELGTFYQWRIDFTQQLQQSLSSDSRFQNYIEVIKNQPGEAVLDFPFCMVGGNGVGGPCPYYTYTAVSFAMQRFHGKKVLGKYFGRMHPEQNQEIINAGWDRMFSPNSDNLHQADQETECFNEEEWQFFTDFFRLNDFSGINLHIDLLPQVCVAEFYRRYGEPVAETKNTSNSTIVFIAKPESLQNQVDLEQGKALQLK